MTIRPGELVIDDDNFSQHTQPQVIDGHPTSFGLIPRDFEVQPVGSIPGGVPYDIKRMPLVPRIEWSERIKEGEANKSFLSHIRRKALDGKPMPSKDQNGQGYCWAYSTCMAIQMLRAKMNLPYVPLSGHSLAWLIKKGRDQGGWCGLSFDEATRRGFVPESLWPAKSMSSQYNTQANWDKAKEFIISDGFIDLSSPIYDRNMSLDQQMTILFNRIPMPGDHNWWGHSICHLDPVEVDARLDIMDPKRWGQRIINSWTDSYGSLGEAVLAGYKAIADSAVAPLLVPV